MATKYKPISNRRYAWTTGQQSVRLATSGYHKKRYGTGWLVLKRHSGGDDRLLGKYKDKASALRKAKKYMRY